MLNSKLVHKYLMSVLCIDLMFANIRIYFCFHEFSSEFSLFF